MVPVSCMLSMPATPNSMAMARPPVAGRAISTPSARKHGASTSTSDHRIAEFRVLLALVELAVIGVHDDAREFAAVDDAVFLVVKPFARLAGKQQALQAAGEPGGDALELAELEVKLAAQLFDFGCRRQRAGEYDFIKASGVGAVRPHAARFLVLVERVGRFARAAGLARFLAHDLFAGETCCLRGKRR